MSPRARTCRRWRVEDCRAAAALVDAKSAPQEAAEYKQWALSVAEKVAMAASEGGFLGFGGEQFSEPEKHFLSEIEAALGAVEPHRLIRRRGGRGPACPLMIRRLTATRIGNSQHRRSTTGLFLRDRPMPSTDSFFNASLAETDPELYAAVEKELGRQQDEIELIASENIVSKAVLEAAGSVLTNKYAEGYPGRRYYGGCQFVDIAEQLAIRQGDGAVRSARLPMSRPIRARRRTSRCCWVSPRRATPSSA